MIRRMSPLSIIGNDSKLFPMRKCWFKYRNDLSHLETEIMRGENEAKVLE